MDTLDYWTPADALAFRCSVEEVGTLRPREPLPVIAGERPDVTEARLYAVRAMRALARLAEGEGRTALEAAKAILDRAYGPALLPAPPPPEAPLPQPEEPWPPYITQQRHAYKMHADDARIDNVDAHMSNVDVQIVNNAHADNQHVDDAHVGMGDGDMVARISDRGRVCGKGGCLIGGSD